jgi:two-component system sensor histidine kinase/response regulator
VEKHLKPNHAALKGHVVLIIDDDPVNLGAMSDYLRHMGLEVLVARDGPSGLEKASYAQPDLILLDVCMPGADGFEICGRLKAEERTRQIPVIFMTALTETENKIKGFKAGGVDYITKPLQFVEVLARVATHLQLNDLRQRLDLKVTQRTAELEASNKELAELCYSMSHNLRAPLRHIDGYMELFLSHGRAGLSDEDLHYLDAVASSARQMGVLIDNLLEFIRTGQVEMQRKRIDMNQALQEALSPVQEASTGRTIEWVISELPSVWGDYSQIRQVWTNLLGNALKFTQSTEATRIEVGSHDGDHEIIFMVSDNGVGFDMQYADNLFGVFQRLHSQEAFEGSGIGLATVKRIINRHGGRVWAEAEPNRGATFYFSLPLTGKSYNEAFSSKK